MKTITILIFSVLLNSCGSNKKAASLNAKSEQSLNGTFTVTKIDGATKLPKDLTLTFNSSENKVSGFSGCNRFFGNYTINGNTIVFKDLGSTKKMCIGNGITVERKMLKALNETTSFKVSNNEITLLNNTIEILAATKSKQ